MLWQDMSCHDCAQGLYNPDKGTGLTERCHVIAYIVMAYAIMAYTVMPI